MERSSPSPRFFLSYRREDAAGHAGRLADHLVARFGAGSVFMDVESIEAGVDFTREIERAIAEASAVLVIIGPAWLDAGVTDGSRRLDQAADLVRAEVEIALGSQVRVIPVLVGGASMPAEDRLPAAISGLSRLNAVEIADRRWRDDVDALSDVLERRVSVCPRCARENPEGAEFCMGCGAALRGSGPAHEVRKTVTVVSCDMSRELPEEPLDPEASRGMLSSSLEAVRAATERHGGTFERSIGDGVIAVFGIPQVHEDDALRAVRAAMDMREALERLGDESAAARGTTSFARIGVVTGAVVAGDPSAGQGLVTGDAVAMAARIGQGAAPGEVLIDEPTYRRVRDSVEVVNIQEEPGPVRFRLLRVSNLFAARPKHMGSAMVGRRRELEALGAAFDRAVSDSACQLFTVLAPAGTGKSRLVEEFLGGVDGATELWGRCVAYGDGITYLPILEIVKQAAGLADFDAPEIIEEKVCRVLDGQDQQEVICGRVAQLLGVESSGTAEETFWALRHFLEAVARRGPLIVVIDDAHWAEPTLLDLVEHVAEWSRDVPILLVCMARPDLLDIRPTWGGGKPNAATITLEPLSEPESEQLIANLLGADVPSDVSDRIVAAAEGNPLYTEEMLAMLVNDGLLVREADRWSPVGDLAKVSTPPTIAALLAARLDRLPLDERRVLEAAAVVGREFFVGAVRDLAPEDMEDLVPSLLTSLVRKDFLRPHRSMLPGEDALRFRHVLIRDAAYDSMPKLARAEAHERVAMWLERVAGDRVAEQEEIVGHHLEQAYRYRTELSPNDPSAAHLAERAGLVLATSGRRAHARGDMGATASLLGRAASLLPVADTRRLGLLPDLSAALDESGEHERAMQLLNEALSLVKQAGDARTRARLLLARGDITGEESYGEAWQQDAEREALEALGVFEAAGDEAGQARAWRALGLLAWNPGRLDSAISSWQQAAAHAAVAGDRAGEAHIRVWLLTAYAHGSVPVEEVLSRAVDTLPFVEGIPAAKAEVLWAVATTNAMLGDFDEAHAAMEASKEIEQDLGRRVTASHFGAQIEARIHRLEGNQQARAQVLREGLEAYREVANEFDPILAALLAEALADLGQDEEAWELAEVAREASHGFIVMPWVLGAEAKVLAHRGQFEEAEQRAREAVKKTPAEFVWGTADALMILGQVLLPTGKLAEAEAVVAEALTRYEAKGIRPFADRARALLETIRGS